ncbi:MAG: hypothetical protein QOE53_704, partial [Pseudonocardiales bacterium]|nr:hypothetical protein [Pseudonocardiales bacterium]
MTRIVDAARPETVQDEPDYQAESALEPQDLTVLSPDAAAWFTIIVPTRNEEGSVRPLLSSLASSLNGIPAEVLFVDDSGDSTPEVIRQTARECGLAVRLLHRSAGNRHGGLGGAVVAGLKHARGTWAVVMDGDMQHPPELVARLVQIGQSRQLDLVAGTRYTGSGASDGLADGYRRAVSGLATRLTKSAFPRRLSRLSDPMSGFFAVRLAALDLDRLDPIGFKILLELMIRQPRLQVAEVPFVFGTRLAGESKASLREGLRFVRHLLRLRLLVLRNQVRRSSATDGAGRFARLVAFGAVGATGIGVNTTALWLFSEHVVNPHYLIAAVLATEVSTSWNFVLTEKFVFRGPKPGTRLGRGIRFFLLNHLALLPRLPLLALLVGVFSTNLLVANVITLALLFLVRFVIADSAIYAKPDDQVVDKQPMRITVDLTGVQRPAESRTGDSQPRHQQNSRPVSATSRYLPYRYSIDGVLSVGSQVPLKELEYFRAQWLGNDADLSIRIGEVGRGPRTRALMTQHVAPAGVTYSEHFGRLGANFRVEIGDKIEVTCSPTLARSPHVLYT